MNKYLKLYLVTVLLAILCIFSGAITVGIVILAIILANHSQNTIWLLLLFSEILTIPFVVCVWGYVSEKLKCVEFS